jgi:branched-chain amino acid transport system substrate-binding protein
MTTRRSFLGGTAAALAVGLPAPAILAQTTKPIRIGLLNSFTGVISYSGPHYYAATAQYFDSINWTIAGRKIEVIKEDDQGSSQIGLEKAKKFIESDKVDLVVGPQASNVAMAVLNYAKQAKFFLLVSGAGTSAVTWERMPYLWRSSLSGWQISAMIAKWNYDNHAKETLLAASDYAGGHDVAAEYRAAYKKLGGTITKEIYPPMGMADFSPYLTDIKALNPKLTYDFFVGTDAVRYVKQYKDMGITAMMTGFAGLVDPTTFEGQGDAALGVQCGMLYTDTLDNPVNKQFAAEYLERNKGAPDMFAEYGYTAAKVIDEAGKLADGDFSNKDKLAEAMSKVAFNAPRGPFRFDPVTHNPIQDIYICEVQKNPNGRLVNNAIHTYTNVQDPGTKQI